MNNIVKAVMITVAVIVVYVISFDLLS